MLYCTVQVWIKGWGNVAPAPRIETGVVGWYPATEDVSEAIEDVTEAIEVALMVADVIIDVSEDIIDVSEDTMDVSDML